MSENTNENNVMEEEYDPEIVTVEDEDGKVHEFEILDAIETDDGKFLALLPCPEDSQEFLDEDMEIIPVQVLEEDDNTILAPIENEELLDEIAEIFEERLADLFEDEEE